jgi:hypothetical protein
MHPHCLIDETDFAVSAWRSHNRREIRIVEMFPLVRFSTFTEGNASENHNQEAVACSPRLRD